MRRAVLVIVFSVVALQIPLAPAADADPPQINSEASAIHDAIPTSDPCVIHFMLADVLDFIDKDRPDQITYNFGAFNICTGEVLANVGQLGQDFIDESAFVVHPGGTGADLDVTLEGFDTVPQSFVPITLDLHWEDLDGVAGGLADVTGTMSSPNVVVVLDDSIVWNRWGSDSFPWAGLWFCVFANPRTGGPGCVGE
jgi:hypothetical protein